MLYLPHSVEENLEFLVEDIHSYIDLLHHYHLKHITKEMPGHLKVKHLKFQIPLILQVDLSKVHPVLFNIFQNPIPQVPLARRLKFFCPNWKVLTSEPYILDILSGNKIPLIQEPLQAFVPSQSSLKDSW